MHFNIKCKGKLPGPKNEFEQSLVFETGEFERPKFDCIIKIVIEKCVPMFIKHCLTQHAQASKNFDLPC